MGGTTGGILDVCTKATGAAGAGGQGSCQSIESLAIGKPGLDMNPPGSLCPRPPPSPALCSKKFFQPERFLIRDRKNSGGNPEPCGAGDVSYQPPAYREPSGCKLRVRPTARSVNSVYVCALISGKTPSDWEPAFITGPREKGGRGDRRRGS